MNFEEWWASRYDGGYDKHYTSKDFALKIWQASAENSRQQALDEAAERFLLSRLQSRTEENVERHNTKT